MRTLRLLHFAGMILWLGGGVALMVLRAAASAERAEIQAAMLRLGAKLQTRVVAAGALLTVVSGLIMSMRLPGVMMGEPRILGMQATGLLGALLVLFVGVPTAARLGRAAMPGPSGDLPAVVETLRRRQAAISSISGLLAVAALVLGTVG